MKLLLDRRSRLCAPYKSINPFFNRRIAHSGKKLSALQRIGGWPHYTTFHDLLRAGVVAATPRTVARLERVAMAVDFPPDEIFLDEMAAVR